MSGLWKQLGVVTAGMFLMVAFQAHAAEGNVAAGEDVYKKTCITCHKENPSKMVGKPVDALVKNISKYKDMVSPTGGAAKMHNAVKDLSAAQMTDVATYLNSLK